MLWPTDARRLRRAGPQGHSVHRPKRCQLCRSSGVTGMAKVGPPDVVSVVEWFHSGRRHCWIQYSVLPIETRAPPADSGEASAESDAGEPT